MSLFFGPGRARLQWLRSRHILASVSQTFWPWFLSSIPIISLSQAFVSVTGRNCRLPSVEKADCCHRCLWSHIAVWFHKFSSTFNCSNASGLNCWKAVHRESDQFMINRKSWLSYGRYVTKWCLVLPHRYIRYKSKELQNIPSGYNVSCNYSGFGETSVAVAGTSCCDVVFGDKTARKQATAQFHFSPLNADTISPNQSCIL